MADERGLPATNVHTEGYIVCPIYNYCYTVAREFNIYQIYVSILFLLFILLITISFRFSSKSNKFAIVILVLSNFRE